MKVFTPMRIVDAQRLARKVAAKPEAYRYAIRECLPRLPALQGDLRAIYLAFAGLLPERPYMDSSSFANNPSSGREVRLLTYIRSRTTAPAPGAGP